jgi:hypothetical protein
MARRLLLFVLLAMFVISACGTPGSGNLVTQDRVAGAFSGIEVSGALRVTVTVDPAAEPAIRVTFDDNLIDIIETRISGARLVIGSTDSYSVSGGGQRIEVTTPALTSVEASGASKVVGFGEVADLDVEVSGASETDLSSLFAERVRVDVSGASDVIVSAGQEATGEASGASEVLVLGNPPVFDIDSSGASDVGTG